MSNARQLELTLTKPLSVMGVVAEPFLLCASKVGNAASSLIPDGANARRARLAHSSWPGPPIVADVGARR